MSGIDTVYLLIQDALHREDREDEIRRRIHMSVLNMHRMDQWKQDLVEQEYVFESNNLAAPVNPTEGGLNSLFQNWVGSTGNAKNIQELKLTQFPFFRKVSYIRKGATIGEGDFTERNPDTAADQFGYDVRDTFYRSGNAILLNSSTPFNRIHWGYFRDPKVNLGNNSLETFQQYESWIVDKYPSVIVGDVIKYYFGITGKTETELKLAVPEYEMQLRIMAINEVQTSTRGN